MRFRVLSKASWNTAKEHFGCFLAHKTCLTSASCAENRHGDLTRLSKLLVDTILVAQPFPKNGQTASASVKDRVRKLAGFSAR